MAVSRTTTKKGKKDGGSARAPKVAAIRAVAAGSVNACERQPNPKAAIEGEYYFLVKVVPVNAPVPVQPMFVTTIHRTSDTRSARKGAAGLDLAVGATTYASGNAFRFEVRDLNSALDSFKDAQCAIESHEGQAWLEDAVDWAIMKAVVS